MISNINFLDVSLNNLITDDIIYIQAVKKLKTKYGLHYYLLTDTKRIYQSNEYIYNLIESLIEKRLLKLENKEYTYNNNNDSFLKIQVINDTEDYNIYKVSVII